MTTPSSLKTLHHHHHQQQQMAGRGGAQMPGARSRMLPCHVYAPGAAVKGHAMPNSSAFPLYPSLVTRMPSKNSLLPSASSPYLPLLSVVSLMIKMKRVGTSLLTNGLVAIRCQPLGVSVDPFRRRLVARQLVFVCRRRGPLAPSTHLARDGSCSRRRRLRHAQA